eukprot:TRINITY_DN870_c0_g1_i1.p1 TRINITY_DN870_c0_g1~~TRINITY_DN870_c0_g1_i1.p1  ORF type:complete len:576 (+),score=232.02 TRINITY_DN870_c0_g1_i1:48-1730(+)
MSSFAQQGTSKASINQDREAEKRRDNALTLRKKKKEELLREKRQKGNDGQKDAMPDGEPAHAPDAEELRRLFENLPTFARLLQEGTLEEKFAAAQAIRKVLSAAEGPPIDRVIELRCVPLLIQLLRCDLSTDTPHDSRLLQVQFESAWALTNVASGTPEHTHHVVEHRAIPEFTRLLSSPSEEVREQVVWALGNIAGDNANMRNMCIAENILPPLLKIVHSGPRLTTLQNATWCLSNLCRNKPLPDFAKIQVALPTLAELLNHTDPDVVADACWALSYVSDGPNERITAVLKLPVVPQLVRLLGEADALVAPALRTVGNIVSGDNAQTQTIIDAGVLPRLKALLQTGRRQLRKECCWTLSNIGAGTLQQREAIVNAGLCGPLVQALSAQEFEVRKEAVWAVTNLTDGGPRPPPGQAAQHAAVRARHVDTVMQAGAMGAMLEVLDIMMATRDTDRRKVVRDADCKMVMSVVMEFVENVLSVGAALANERDCENAYKNDFIALDGLERLQVLQMSQDKDLLALVGACMQFLNDVVEYADDDGELAFDDPAPLDAAAADKLSF